MAIGVAVSPYDGVNYCHSHCHLAKLRGLMIEETIRRCDWLHKYHNLECQTGHI
jgi:hypothetical protein